MLKRVIILASIFIGLAIALSYYKFELDRIDRINNAIRRSEELLREKRDNVRVYKEQVEFYKTREGIEHLAREQYNLVLPGERVILLRSPDAAPE